MITSSEKPDHNAELTSVSHEILLWLFAGASLASLCFVIGLFCGFVLG